MLFTRINLLNELSQRTAASSQAAEQFQALSPEQLNLKKEATSWSILECIAHLNLYGDFYLPRLAQIIAQAAPATEQTEFKTGWLGNYFANMMLVKGGKISNKMKTFKDKNPINSKLGAEQLSKFLIQQVKLADLLVKAANLDLNRNRCPTTLSRFIRLKLGDTFRFFVYHIERHILQASNVLK